MPRAPISLIARCSSGPQPRAASMPIACAIGLASEDDVAQVEREARVRQGGRHRRGALFHLRRHCRRAGRAVAGASCASDRARGERARQTSRRGIAGIDQNSCPRAKRSASTRIALAEIHEPRMRTPMRCHSRMQCIVPATTAASDHACAEPGADQHDGLPARAKSPAAANPIRVQGRSTAAGAAHKSAGNGRASATRLALVPVAASRILSANVWRTAKAIAASPAANPAPNKHERRSAVRRDSAGR